MKYWLVKSEPSAWSWDDMIRERTTYWDGVRNYQARNNLMEMKVGDEVLFYHSVSAKSVVGICRVTRTAYQDPTTEDERWRVVDLEAVRPLERPISLAEIKATPSLAEIALIRQSRLSVMPLLAREYRTILKMAGRPPKT